jgi:hypothetical protein
MHLPRHTDPLVGSWSNFAKDLPPDGRNSQEEVASLEQDCLGWGGNCQHLASTSALPIMQRNLNNAY